MRPGRGLAALVLCLALAASPAVAQGIPDLVERTRPSVAFVLAEGEPTRSGTAFAVDAGGLLVTALHVLENARRLQVQFPGGRPERADAVGADPARDLAVLRIARAGLAPLPVAAPGGLRVGEEIVVLGFPRSDVLGTADVTVTRGIVSALQTPQGYVQVDASMNPGVSGGPVLNLAGEVVGVAVAGLRGAQNINFAVPAGVLLAALARQAERGGAAAASLALPLTGIAARQLQYRSQPITSSRGRLERGVACLEPPPSAVRIIGVDGRIGTPRPIDVVAWLSLGGGALPGSPQSFAHMSAIDVRRSGVTVNGLDLPAAPVCLSYQAKSSGLATILPVYTFEVRYTVRYRVWNVPL